MIISILSKVMKFSGTFYYLFDNIVWIADMGAIWEEIIENFINWRNVKDMFSLLKNVCESLKSVINVNIHMAKERELE